MTKRNNPEITSKYDVNSKQYTVDYVYSLQFTPSLDGGQAKTKVFSFRCSPDQYKFLQATPNSGGILRRFVDSLRIEEMNPEDEIMVLLTEAKKITQHIQFLTHNREYKEALELINDIPPRVPPRVPRPATPREYKTNKNAKAKEFFDYDGEKSEYLNELEGEGNFNFKIVYEPNPKHDRLTALIKATEKKLERKHERLGDIQTKIRILKRRI